MKTAPHNFFSLARTAALALALLAAPSLHAVTYYWDANDATAGFGTAGGTWAAPTTNNATQGWSTAVAGNTTLSGNTTTTTSDALNFGTASNQLGTGTITVSGSVSANTITLVGSSSNITLSGGNITLQGGITATNSANTSVITETISSNITLGANQTWTVNNGGSTGTANLAVSGIVSGANMSLTKAGNGTLILSGLNTFSGGTTINGGTLQLKAAATNAFNTGNLTYNINNASTLLLSTGAASNPTGQGMVVNFDSNGGGTLTLDSGLNFLLQNTGFFINTNGGAQNTLAGSGFLNDQGTNTPVVFNIASGSNSTADFLVTGGMGRAAITKNGTGKLLFTTANVGTFGSGITDIRINAGTMEFGGGVTLTQNTGYVFANNGTFSWNSTGSSTISNNITGTGVITKSNSGTLTLSGNNTYSGATTINAGTLQIGAGGTSGSLSASSALTNNGTLTFNRTDAVTQGTHFASTIRGTGNVTQAGTGTLTLSGNNTYTGTTTISAGTLTISGGSAIANNGAVTLANATSTALNVNSSETIGNLSGGGSLGGNIAIASGQTLTVNQTSSLTYNGSISGAGGLTINGTSQLQLMGNNSFTGMTTINSGTLRLQGPNPNPTIVGDITINGGSLTLGASSQIADTSSVTLTNGSFELSTLAETIASITMSGGNLRKAGTAGQLLLNAASSFTGGTVDFAANNAKITTNATTTLGNVTFIFSQANGTSNQGLSLGGDIIVNANTTANFTNSGGGLGRIDLNAANRTIDVGTGATMNVGWNIAGTSVGITKNGSGSLVLTAANTYNGTTTINVGTIQMGHANGLGSGGNITFGGGDLQYGSGITTDISSRIKNSGSEIVIDTNSNDVTFASAVDTTNTLGLTKNGSGTLALSGNNTYTGATTINAGTLQIGAGGTTGSLSSSSSIANNATLVFNRTDSITQGTHFNSVIAGTGALIQAGSGTVTLSGNNTYSGATTISAGTLAVTGNISSSATTVATGGTLSGTGRVGATTVNAGGILSPNTSETAGTLTTSSLTINGGGYNWTIANGSNFVTAGTDYDQIITTGAMTLNNTEASPFTVYVYGDATGWNGQVNKTWNIMTAGSMSGFNAGNFSINFDNFGIAAENRAGTWTFNATSGTNITLAYTLQTPNYYWDGASGNWSDSYVANTRGFNPGPPENDKNIFLTGSGGTVTNNIANGTLTSLGFITFNSTAGAYTLAANAGSSGASGGTALTVLGDIINNSSTAQTINLAMAFTGSSTGTINAAAGNITIGGVISGSGALSKTGGNTLVLSASNTYSGGTTLRNGTLAINNATAIGTGALTIVSGTLGNTSGANITLTNNNAQNWNGNFTYNSAKDLNMGTGAVSMNASRTVTISSSNFTVGGIISGAGYGLTKNGSGTMILSGVNTYTGATTINAGTLTANGGSAIANASAVSVGSGAVFNLGASETVGSIAGAGNITLGSFTLTAGGDNSSTTASGVISGTGALTKTGTGALTLSGSNTYNGATTLSAGTLKAGSSTGISSASALTVSAGVLDLNGFNATVASVTAGNAAGTITNTASGSGTNTLTITNLNVAFAPLITDGATAKTALVMGGGQSTPSFANANNTFSGGITIASGSNTRLWQGTVTNTLNGTTLTKSNLGTGTIYIGANGSTGNSQLMLSSGSIYNNIVVNAASYIDGGLAAFRLDGTVALYGTITAGASDINMSSGSTGSATAYGQLTGTNGLVLKAPGTAFTLTLNNTVNAANNYSGNTTISANTTLALGAANQIANGAGKGNLIINSGNFTMGGFSETINGLSGNGTIDGVSGTPTLTVGDNDATSTFSGVIKNTAGNLALTKNGTGTLTLSGNSTHTGATTVNAGTLTVSGNISSSASTIASGATLDGAGRVGAVTVSGTMAGTLTAGNITVSSGGLLSPSGTGSVGTIAAGNITLSAGSGYAWTLANATGAAGTGFDQVTGTGALTLSNTAASPFTVYVFGNATNWSGNTTSWNIISAASQTGFSTGNFAINLASFGIASANRTGTWSFTNPSGGNITLNYTAAGADSIWAGTTGVWSGNFTPGVSTDKNITFTGDGGTATNDIASGTLSSVNFITFNSTAGAYTLNATTGAAGLAGGTALTVNGDIINNSSNATGQTIAMGLNFGSSSTGIINTAAGNITISGNLSGAGTLTKSGNYALTLSGASKSNTGDVTINAGNVTVSGGALNTNITVNSGANLIAGSNYIISQSGSKILTINGGTLSITNTYQEPSGGIVLNNATINGNSVGAIAAQGIGWSATGNNTINHQVSLENAKTNSWIFNIQSGTTTINSNIVTQVSRFIGLTKNGSGTLVLNGNNTAGTTSNATTLNAGTLVLNNNNAIGNTTFTINGGTLDNTSGSAITLTNNNTQSWNGDFAFLGTNGSLNMGAGNVTMNASRTVTVNGGNFIVDGKISGAGFGLTKNGSGTLRINPSSTYSGATAINGGTLQIHNTAGTIGWDAGTIAINNGSTLEFTGTGQTVFEGAGDNITFDSAGGGSILLTMNPIFRTGTSIITTGGAMNTISGTWINGQNTHFITYDTAVGTGAAALQVGSNHLNIGIIKNGLGTLLLTDVSNGMAQTGNTLTINAGTLEIGSAGRLNAGSYDRAITNNGTFSYNSTAAQTLSGNITGTGNLTKSNNSTLTLSGANTYTGLTTVNAGTLAISNNMTIGAIAGAGNMTLGSGFTLGTNSSTNSTFSGVISSSGALMKNGTSTLTLSGNNTYSGGTTLNAGGININAATAIGNGTLTIVSGTLDNTSGANLTLTSNNAQNWNGDFTFTGTKDLNMGTGAVTMNASRTVTVNAGNFTIGGNISGSTFGLTKNGSGTMILSGANTYNGTTTINAGTLTASGGSAIVDTGAVTIASGAAFNIGANETVGSIAGAGNIALGSYTLTSGGDNSSTTLSGVLSGTGNLIKSGTGNLTLTGISTFSGATTISGGKLVVNGSAANSAVTIGNGGTLAGSGSVGAVTVGAGGLIAPGNSPGNIYASTLTLEGGGGYTWEVANVAGTAGVDWDLITVGGGSGASTITANATNQFTIYISGNPTGWNTNTSTSWNIIDWGTVTNFDASFFSVNTTAFTGTAPVGTWAVSNTAGYLSLDYIAGDPTWNGGTGNWDSGFTPNLTGGNMSICFAGNNTATATNNIASATVGSVASITFNSTAGAYTLAANSGSAGYDTASALQLNGNIVNDSSATQTINLALTSTATRVYDAAAGNLAIGGVISGAGGLTKNGSGMLTLSGNNTYSGTTTINAGTLEIASTGLLGGGNYTGNIANAGAFLIGSNSNQTLSGVISGIGALTKNGSGTLTLAGNNNFSGGTTLNTGTLVIGNAAAAGTGTITQTSGSSLLKIDTTGTITNDMSVYNVLASQSATLSGAITVNNATWDIDTGDTLTISGAVSGNGGVTKNGGGTLILSGNNTYLAPTVINAGTLNAASVNALGSNNTVTVYGGSLLVTADDAINGMTVTLNSTSTNVAGLAFNGTYSGLVDNLTLSKNSIIDLGNGSVSIMFDTFVMNSFTLDIYNWTGTTLWNGGTGNDTDKVYFGPDLSDAALAKIYFHSGAVGGGDSFLGSGYDLGLQQTSWDSGLDGYHIIPVPEPETYATGLLLLLGGAWWMWRKRSVFTT